jgi:lysozyme family protein
MANFFLFIPLLQKVEGGYQNLAGDSGNYNSLNQRVGTNYGISARFYEDIIGRPPTVADMKAITKDKAKQLYKKYFWDDVHGDILKNQSVANLIADHAVNAGESSIGVIVQKILNNQYGKGLKIDGDIGIKTAQAINSIPNQEELFNLIKKGRENDYIKKGGEFLTGWLTRLKTFVYSEKKQ